MDKVRMGFIGVGNRGSQLLGYFLEHADMQLVALSDVYTPFLERDRSKVDPRCMTSGKTPEMGESIPDTVDKYTDFRDLLDRKDIDAVCIASPDHWHAVQTITAFRSGKDVFVEKPLTATVREGRRMVEVERETKKIGAACLNRRGSTVYRKLAEQVQGGRIGKVVSAYAAHSSNMFPKGIGKEKPTTPPDGFDWDMWLGPRAKRDFQFNIAPYYFRWWSEYSSQMGNWGVHYMDVIRWMVGETAPVAVTAVGGTYGIDDDRNIPDTLTALFEFPSGCLVQFQVNEASPGYRIEGGEIELRGTKGTIVADQDGYRIIPSARGQFQDRKVLTEPGDYFLEGETSFGDLGIKENSTDTLIRNFLDCVKDRVEPYCSLEDAHRSTSFAHLANIAFKTGQRLLWDSDTERFTNSDEANTHLEYEYRAPWSLD